MLRRGSSVVGSKRGKGLGCYQLYYLLWRALRFRLYFLFRYMTYNPQSFTVSFFPF